MDTEIVSFNLAEVEFEYTSTEETYHNYDKYKSIVEKDNLVPLNLHSKNKDIVWCTKRYLKKRKKGSGDDSKKDN